MATAMTDGATVSGTTAEPAYQAYQILHWGFVAAPIIAGTDKFMHLLTNWDEYLAPAIAQMLPISGHAFMLVVGVIEIVAGLLVAVRPRIGAYVVAGWLVGIMLNLIIRGHALDIVLRDFGLCLGALALARLATTYDRPAGRG
jgi:uncharacterized membrane protein YphA (DoxX/SURF4 family)